MSNHLVEIAGKMRKAEMIAAKKQDEAMADWERRNMEWMSKLWPHQRRQLFKRPMRYPRRRSRYPKRTT